MTDEEPRKPRGRPKSFGEAVSVRLPTALHDALSLEALRRDVELSRVIRERLARPVTTRPE